MRPLVTGERWLLSLAVIFSLLSWAFPIFVQTFLPPPLEYRGLPWPVLNAPIRDGDPLHVRLEACNHENSKLSFTYTRTLVRDGLVIALFPGSFTLQPGCQTIDAGFQVLSGNLEPGIYVLKGVSTARGFWRIVDVPWETEPFEILPCEKPC